MRGAKPGTQRRARRAVGALAAVLVLAVAPAAARAEEWFNWRRFYIRGIGVAHIATFEQSHEMELADIDGPASLAVQNGPIAGSGASASSATIPAFILGYRLPVLKQRLSLETILSVLPFIPVRMTFRATGTLANESIAPEALGIPSGVPALGPELGEVKALPGVITAVYQLPEHFRVRPYGGAGVALLLATSAKVTNPILTEVSDPEMTVAPAPGLVLQGGVDVRLWKSVYARVDVKFIAGMLAKAEVHHAEVRTPLIPLFDTVEVGTAKMSMWVNPVIVQAGLGFDFAMF